MFDVIDALEVLGADADLAGASSASVDAMLQAAGAERALRSALLEGGDAGTLETLLRAPKHICIFIHPAEEEEEEPEDEEEDEEEEDEEGEEDGDDDEDGADSGKKPKPRGS